MARKNKCQQSFFPPDGVHIAFSLGLLLLTLAMLRIPAMRVPGLILTPLLWTAFCIALLMRKKSYSLVSYGWTLLAVMLAGLGLLWLSSAASEAQGYCVWLVTAVGVLLFLPPLLAAEKRVPKNRTQDAFAVRALGLLLVMLIQCYGWASASNVVFDQSAGTEFAGCIARKWQSSRRRSAARYHIHVQLDSQTEEVRFNVGKQTYETLYEGEKMVLTKHDGFWNAPYWTFTPAEAENS